MSAPPGWFQDSERPPGHLRWWDGEQWSEHRTTPPAAPRSTGAGWVARHPWLVVASAFVALVMIMSAVGAATEDSNDTGGSMADPGRAARSDDATEPAGEAEVNQSPTEDPTPEPAKRTRRPRPQEPRTYLVTRIVDGDTLELGNGEIVRLVGIDTPEVGDCGFERAADNLAALVLGKAVVLGASDEDRDAYGRLLRYIDIGDQDAGLRLIKNGLAIARYDSRDGYGFHPRERVYVANDKGAKQFTCAPKPQPFVPQQPPAGGNCASGYDPCVPPYPPDVDCADVNGPIYVSGSDPHGLDADNDGVACE